MLREDDVMICHLISLLKDSKPSTVVCFKQVSAVPVKLQRMHVHTCAHAHTGRMHTAHSTLAEAAPPRGAGGAAACRSTYSLELMEVMWRARGGTLHIPTAAEKLWRLQLSSLLWVFTTPLSDLQTPREPQIMTSWHCQEIWNENRVMMWQTKLCVIKTNWEALKNGRHSSEKAQKISLLTIVKQPCTQVTVCRKKFKKHCFIVNILLQTIK